MAELWLDTNLDRLPLEKFIVRSRRKASSLWCFDWGEIGKSNQSIKKNIKTVKSDHDSEYDFIEYEDNEEEPQTTPDINEAVDS